MSGHTGSGQTGMEPGCDEAARLEQALARIAQALTRRARPAPAEKPPLQAPASNGTTPGRDGGGVPDAAHIAARLDSLILELRLLLGEPDI